jgi:hypothetical protein
MENRKAIEIFNKWMDCKDAYQADPSCDGRCHSCKYNTSAEEEREAMTMAISALEKQIPKKPKHIDKNAIFDGNWKRVCPACGRMLVERITTPEKSYPRIYNHSPHCICGQAIDWEEEA